MTHLKVVMYHYVRDVAGTRFPGLKALATDAFRTQVANLKDRFEMASLESALAFLSGSYQPSRPLCLLTFDDGLDEHATTVTPVLADAEVEGVFLLPTACMAHGEVLPVHKNHCLMGNLGFEEYRRRFLAALAARGEVTELSEDETAAALKTYRWDTPEVKAFKYLVNYRIDDAVRVAVLNELFADVLGDEAAFAKDFYVTFAQSRHMQDAGMVLGGHTHRHPVLSACTPARQHDELKTSLGILKEHLSSQPRWPFAYPFGKRTTFDGGTLALLEELGYECAFTTEVGDAPPGTSRFEIPRVDTKDV
ncbi:MAG: polysaccharide deacetylase family protein [Myxococcota bacterium]